MSNEQWRRIEEVFAAALEQPPEARADFVARACADDPVRREQAASLLAAWSASEGFLGEPALDSLARQMADDGWGLRAGQQIGAYTLVQLLGAGGSGQVWRARDGRLARDVAIKFLLPHIAGDPGQLRRFADEARAAGSLNHPNVLAVFDIGEHHETPYLVTEYLDGHTLRAQLARGPMPVPRAVAVATEIARGLAAAHARRIVHRDLKPDNVFLAAGGGVKILDFGVAKLQALPEEQPPARLTLSGVIVGTAGYMAPEQARGDAVDARADLFGLGVTLYEMLSGRRPFTGDSTVEVLHAILTVDPPDLAGTTPAVPVPLAKTVTRLLEKSREARFQTADEVVEALESLDRRALATPKDGTPARWRRAVAAGAIAAALVGAGWWLRGPQPASPPTDAVRFTWTLPAGLALASAPVVSPAGDAIAFVASDGATSRLFVRRMRSLDADVVGGSEQAVLPFWAPDGRALGFFARGTLWTVSLAGGAPVAVCEARRPGGAAWTSSGLILVAADATRGIESVPVSGGHRVVLTRVDTGRGETLHQWPTLLPDGERFVYAVGANGDSRWAWSLGRLGAARPDRGAMVPAGREAAFVPTSAGVGWLLQTEQDRLVARRVDVGRMEAGAPTTLGFAGAPPATWQGPAISATPAVLAMGSTASRERQIVTASLESGIGVPQGRRDGRRSPRLSPDGRFLATVRLGPDDGERQVWVDDLSTGATSRVPFPAASLAPVVWGPDGRRIAYASGRGDEQRVLVIEVAGEAPALLEDIRCPARACTPTDWSPDGQRLIVAADGLAGPDVWSVWTGARGLAQPLLATPAAEREARLSPDGRWLAYVSGPPAAETVAVVHASGSAPAFVVAAGGAAQPVWRRDGARLFYVDASGRLHGRTARTTATGRLEFGPAVPYGLPAIAVGGGTQYDVTPDGRRLYLVPAAQPDALPGVEVVVGWQALLRNRPDPR